MKLSLSLILSISLQSIFAQTAIIAHKSHNGSAVDLTFADPANYGGPPIYTKQLTRINDTVIDAEMGGRGLERVLIINHEALLDSVRSEVTDTAVWVQEWELLMGRDTTAELVPLSPGENPQEKLEELKQQRSTKEKTTLPVKSKSGEGSLTTFFVIMLLAATFGVVRKRFLRA